MRMVGVGRLDCAKARGEAEVLRSLMTMLSPAGASARLSTLIFHRVLPNRDPLFPDEIDAAQFDAVCGWLRQWFNVMPLREAVDRLFSGTLCERALALTFDDGYADNLHVAAPILRRHQLPCTFFIATGYLDGGRMWNDSLVESIRATHLQRISLDGIECLKDLPTKTINLDGVVARRRAIDYLIQHIKYLAPRSRDASVAAIERAAGASLPSDLMLTSEQVLSLHRGGFEIGAHTVTHPILARLSPGEIHREIAMNRAQLRELTLGADVALFAYPNGKPGADYNQASIDVTKQLGFEAALSTSWGVAVRQSDRYQLPRFTPWDRRRHAFGLRMALNLSRLSA